MGTKIISQRKTQDKYFIDCCVAMKALRNFCNVLFKTADEQTTTDEQKEIGVIVKVEKQEKESESSGTSLFSTLRSKLPQRKSPSSTPTNSSGAAKKTFFNISPTNTFSNFINKNKKNELSESPLPVPKTQAPKPNSLEIISDEEQQNMKKEEDDKIEQDEHANDDIQDADIMVQVSTKLS